MAKLPLNQEQHLDVAPLRGQQGRRPQTAVDPGKASVADNTSHQGMVLSRAPGNRKRIQTPVPGSGYEVGGLQRGFVQLPIDSSFDYENNAWAIEGCFKILELGRIQESGDRRRLFFTTDLDNQQLGNMAEEGNSVRVAFQSDGDDFYFQLLWGNFSSSQLPLTLGAGVIDPADWMKIHVAFDGTDTCTLSVRQPQTNSSVASVSFQRVGEKPRVSMISLGGRPSIFSPWFGHRDILKCVVTEVRLYHTDAEGNEDSYTRASAGGNLEAVWPLSDSKKTGILSDPAGYEGRLRGNRVHREELDNPIGSGEGKALYMSGTGAVLIPNAHRYRKPPGEDTSTDVPGYYLERDELTVGFFFRPDPYSPFLRFEGWRQDPEAAPGTPSEDRACLFCWSTPNAQLLSRTETHGAYHTSGGVVNHDGEPVGTSRPSEHLRIELTKQNGFYGIVAHWGELDPESLKGPTGVPGTSTSTSWPPTLDYSGNPPPTFNCPKQSDGGGGNTYAITDYRAQNSQVCTIGNETTSVVGLDNPLQYDWLILASRKFVDQGDADNRCRLICVPFNRSTGQWESTAAFRYSGQPDTVGYGLDKNVAPGAANAKLYPDNQSCFTSDYIGVVGLNYRPDVYAMCLGAGLPTQYGDEWIGATTGNLTNIARPGLAPVQGDQGYAIHTAIQGHGAVGWYKDLFILDKYLEISDAKTIATSGGFAEEMQLAFGKNVLGAWTFSEGSGNVLRDAKGNDISFTQKFLVVDEPGFYPDTIDSNEDAVSYLGAFPRSRPPYHNEVDLFTGESSPVTGLVQRLDSEGNEEVYVTALPGLYRYRRDNNDLVRVLTLPGQGGPNRSSIAMDDGDVIHIAGNGGKPVIITRNKTVAVSGLESPRYSAPDTLITAPASLAGGIGVNPQYRQSTNQDDLVGWEIPDSTQVTFAIGYWSDVLRTRSAPGPVATCRFTDPTVPPQNSNPFKRHRIQLTGLPVPESDNEELITHWEVYRTRVNGDRLFLETRIPIGAKPGSAIVGYKLDNGLIEQADFLRAPPPEGIRHIGVLGERLFGVGLPDAPRSLIWSRLRDTTIFPPIYEYTLTHTQSKAVGVVARRDRAFALSRDFMYQIYDKLTDVDADQRLLDSVVVTPITEGAGALNQDAVADDEENGLYLFGNKTVYLTEGGIFRSVSKDNDSAGFVGSSWSWPDSWDLSDPDAFVAFHDEKRRLVGVCGPSADDSSRRDALVICYENTTTEGDGNTRVAVEMSRIKDLGATVFETIFNPDTGEKEVWYGADNGYLYRFGVGASNRVDYDYDPGSGSGAIVTPKVGVILQRFGQTVRIEATYAGYPSDVLVGSVFRVYREGVLISETEIITVITLGASWTDIRTDTNSQANAGDTFTIGAMPMEWRSGEMDMGSMMQDIRSINADIRLKRT